MPYIAQNRRFVKNCAAFFIDDDDSGNRKKAFHRMRFG